MKRAILTGATGAIGTALIKTLLEHGVEVLVFLRQDSARGGNLPEHPLLSVTYCALDELSEVQNAAGKAYDVFYHFAWDGTTGASRQDMYRQNLNVKYTLDAIGAAKRFGCHTFIGAGSQAEYGRCEGALTPTTPTFPENGYGIAKLAAGQMGRIYAGQLGLRFIWTRILSVYGPNDSAGSMISSTVAKLQRGEEAPFTKGEQLWDFLYSGDAAEAFRLIGEKGADGKIYVLGSGRPRPLSEYISVIGQALGAEDKLKLGALPYAEKQVMRLEADISALTQDTGWEPKTSFEEGIRETIK